uniref:Uncharacterized protein n=1 Tax=Peronospora matthiolae TaxID=2874970 RepID=A0AAV1U908_9STRA
MASHTKHSFDLRAVQEPKPMEIYSLERDPYSRRIVSHETRKIVVMSQLISFRCRKPGDRVAVCRAPMPVLAVAESVTSNEAASQTKKPGQPVGERRPAGRRRRDVLQVVTRSSILSALHAQLCATTSGSEIQQIVLSAHIDGATPASSAAGLGRDEQLRSPRKCKDIPHPDARLNLQER